MAIDWCPFATKRPIVADNFMKGRNGRPVKAVVLHIAAGNLPGVFPTFNDPTRGASAHFCIGKNGTIEQYVSVNDTAFANGLRWDAQNQQWICPHNNIVQPSWQDLTPPDNPNWYTVSIEHEGMPQDKWTSDMYDANMRLQLWLSDQFQLTYVAHRTLVGHFEIDPVDKPSCPGPNVEWDRIVADAAAIQAARKLTWMPINTDSALYNFAEAQNLGYPQTDEYEFTSGGATYVGQVYNLGIVFVKKGDWGNVLWMKKPM
ncbi:MAG: N-acetylmuramoyl-L-alanine amidase [Chloroflexi bacterium]|nr:N-acetylmuramoyl-L-alanine amidase [Chloroflexota bacterium]